MIDVFISYKREERDAVTTIAERLRALKLAVWFDADLTQGATFDQEIAANLTAAKCVLVCWTPAAIASEWVRGEAALAREEDRLVACFLEPTKLTPPFNLQHTENLMRWAGQDDDPAWIRLLEEIGGRVGRPGIASFAAAMTPGVTLDTLRSWATAHGDDPLAEHVWGRIGLIEGEGANERLAREALEARSRGQRRKAEEARSKALAKARGLRDPARQRRRILILTGAIAAIGAVALGGVTYSLDTQRRATRLARAETPEELKDFLSENAWHPVSRDARQKYRSLDAAAWIDARTIGTVGAIRGYIETFTGPPEGQFLGPAEVALGNADRVRRAQIALARLQIYNGPTHGGLDTPTRDAVESFRFRSGTPVSAEVDDELVEALELTVAGLPAIPPSMLVARRLGEPNEDEYRVLAARTELEAPTLYALRTVEAVERGFGSDGRPVIYFYPHIFSRLTGHAFDSSHPRVSKPQHTVDPTYFREAWSLLSEAFTLDPSAAYQATEYGLFKMIGSQYQHLGFDSPGEMAWFLSQSEANQLEVFVRYVEGAGLLPALRQRDWRQVAARLRGTSQGRSDEELARAYSEGLRALGFFAAEARGNETLAQGDGDLNGEPTPPLVPAPASVTAEAGGNETLAQGDGESKAGPTPPLVPAPTSGTCEIGAPIGRRAGVVMWWNPEKGFGFISPLPPGGGAVFVQHESVPDEDHQRMTEGACLTYRPFQGASGPAAADVRLR